MEVFLNTTGNRSRFLFGGSALFLTGCNGKFQEAFAPVPPPTVTSSNSSPLQAGRTKALNILNVKRSKLLSQAGVLGYKDKTGVYVVQASFIPQRPGKLRPLDYGAGGCYPDDFTCLQSAGLCEYSNRNCAQDIAFVSHARPGVTVDYYVWDPTTVASSYTWNAPGAPGGSGGQNGPVYSVTDPPANHCGDAAGGFAGALGGIAGAILASGAYNSVATQAANDFNAGVIEGVVFAGILLSALPVEAVAGLAIAVGLSVVALFALLACHS